MNVTRSQIINALLLLFSLAFSIILVWASLVVTSSHVSVAEAASCSMQTAPAYENIAMFESDYDAAPHCGATPPYQIGGSCSGGESCVVDSGGGYRWLCGIQNCVAVTVYTCSCTMGPAVISVTPTSHDFGDVTIGNSATYSFTVRNMGESTLTGSVTGLSGAFSCTSGCSYDLGAGGSQTVRVQFSPTGATSYNDTANFSGGGGASVTVSGAGTSAASNCTWQQVDYCPGNLCINQYQGSNFPNCSVIGTSCSVDGQLQGCNSSTNLQLYCSCSGSAPPPLISVSPGSQDFGTVNVGSSLSKTFTVKNVGGGALSGSVTGLSGAFSCTSGCSYDLGAGGSQTVRVQFSPTGATSYNDTANFSGGGGASAGVSGVGGALSAAISVSPSPFDYGDVPVWGTVDQTFTVTNTGSGTLSGNVTFAKGTAFFCLSGCSYSLSAGSSQPVKIRFVPPTAGPYNDTAAFSGSGGVNVPLSGTGVAASSCDCEWVCNNGATGGPVSASDIYTCGSIAGSSCLMSGSSLNSASCYPSSNPSLSVIPSSLNFGNVTVGSTPTMTVTVKNVGTGILNGSVSGLSAPFSCISGSCSYSLAGGNSQVITIRFSPSSAIPYSDTALFSGAEGASVSVMGTGASVGGGTPPTITSFTASQNPITAGDSTTLSWTATGNPLGTCRVRDLTSGTNYSGYSFTDSLPVAPVSTRTYRLTCTNGNSPDATADLTITVNPLSGPSILVTPPTWTYNTTVGSPVPKTFAVQNVGTGTLDGNVSWVGPGYICTAGCTYSIPAGVSKNVTIRFNPPSAGSYDTAFVFSGGGDQSVPITATAANPAPADIAITDPTGGSLDFGLIRLPTTGVSKTITIKNIGASPLSGSAVVTGKGYSCGATCTYVSIPPGGTYVTTITFDPPDDNGGSPDTGSVLFSGGVSTPNVSLAGRAYYPVSISDFHGPSGPGTNYEQLVVGGTIDLTWTGVTGTKVSCLGSHTSDNGGWDGGPKTVPGGTQNVGPVFNSSTYTLNCTSPYDPVGKHPRITVDIVVPVMSLSASPVQVLKGKSANVNWEAQYYADCTLTDNSGGTVATGLSGTYVTPAIEDDTTYTLTCSSLIAAPDDTRSITIHPFIPTYIEQ